MNYPLSSEEPAAHLASPQQTGELVPRIDFADHFEWLYRTVTPGQHFAIVAPTGAGKTHLIRWLLLLFVRYPVLFLQFKRRDPTLNGMGKRITSLPSVIDRMHYASRPYASKRWATDPEWYRLQLPEYRWTEGPKNPSHLGARRVAGQALDWAYRHGGMVVVADDVRALTDNEQPALGLRAPIENQLQHGRTAPVSVIAAVQQPVHAPGSLYDQASHIYLGKMLDVGRHERLAEIGGDTKLLKAVLPTLKRQEFLYIYREAPEEMVIIRAPTRRPGIPEREAMLRGWGFVYNRRQMRGSVLGQILYVGSAMVLVKFAVDVLMGAFPDVVGIRTLKQAVS